MIGAIGERVRAAVRSVRDRNDGDAGPTQRLPVTLLELAYVAVLLVAVDLSMDGRTDLGIGSITVAEDGLLVSVPEGVYVYALLGAGAYAATSLVFEPKESLTEVKRLGYRVLAALPLGAGVFLLASFVVGPDVAGSGQGSNGSTPGPAGPDAVVAGLAFVAGLYVRLTLRKLGDVAETIYNVGDVRTGSHKELRKRHEATTTLRNAWQIPAREGTTPAELSSAGYDDLRRAETLLESDDATLQQLDRAVALGREAGEKFAAAAGDGAVTDGTDG